MTAHIAGKQKNIVMFPEDALGDDVALSWFLVELAGRVGAGTGREFAHGVISLSVVDGSRWMMDEKTTIYIIG